MRRWFVLLMLALLPLQFSWAAVAGYCGHGGEQAEQHFGHHRHSHPAADAAHGAAQADHLPVDVGTAEVDLGEDQPAQADLCLDCGHCHGGCNLMPAAPPTLPGQPAAVRPSVAPGTALPALAPQRPERPQWPPLA
ncbi:MAG: hypothetical protein ACK5QH_11710 [Rubrivivax sp.]|jgi:hypothetical protein